MLSILQHHASSAQHNIINIKKLIIRFITNILFATATLFSLNAAAHALERECHALVIGNADYQQGKLANPVNDARAVAATLQQLGFKVTELENADQEQMETAVRDFGEALNADTVGLFYFSGHGVQHNGQNYLIPINVMSQVNTADQLRYKTVDASYILDTMKQSGSGLNLFFLDACRNTPFKSFARSANVGLARISGAEGTLIAYATAPGTVAYDGHGQNSPYTKNLLYWMRQPDIPIELALKKVRAGVKKETANKQSPWYEVSIDGDFYFNPTGQNVSATATNIGESYVQNETATASAQASPSFDCQRATTATEYAICQSQTLANLDNQLAFLYSKKRHESGISATQKQWLLARNQCGNNKNCLIQAYEDRLNQLSDKVSPSFDCHKAGTASEHAICNSPELSRLDRKMVQLYRKKPKSKYLKETQRAWLKRRNKCAADVTCLTRAYQERITEL